MANSIVTVNVSQIQAPTPNNLQGKAAYISQGGTTLTANAYQLITQQSDLTAILKGSITLSNLVWSSGTVTATTSTPHSWPMGKTFAATVAGVSPAAYNGTYQVTVTGASTVTYALATNPGAVTVQGTITDYDVAEAVAFATTWFAQGLNTPFYVLELGQGSVADGVAALTTYIANNRVAYGAGTFYNYCVPFGWDAESTFLTLANLYVSTNSKTYFWVPCTMSTYSNFVGIKSVIACLQTPSAAATEMTYASLACNRTALAPSSTNKVTPASFQYSLGGTTVYPASSSESTALKAAFVNWVTTGAEGGISNQMWQWGTNSDGRNMAYWYSVDWSQINIDLNIANEIINGSNNAQNPLYFNQQGIDRLQRRAGQVLSNGIAYGMLLGNVILTKLDQATFITNLNAGVYAGNCVINAIPFATYNAQNPSDYRNGIYNGMSAVISTQNSFTQILFNIAVTDFVGA